MQVELRRGLPRVEGGEPWPPAGTVEVEGKDVTHADPVALRRSIGYVMQASGLMPHRTVSENIMTVPRLQGGSRASGRKRAEEHFAWEAIAERTLEVYRAAIERH